MTKKKPIPKLYTAKQAADILGTTPKTIYEMLARGDIRKIGTSFVRIPETEVAKLMRLVPASQARKPKARKPDESTSQLRRL